MPVKSSTLRWLLAGLFLLFWTSPASAAFTLVGQDVVICTAAVSCQIDNAVTAQSGDLVVLMLARRNNCATANMDNLAISDGTNGAYTLNNSARICDSSNSGAGSAIGYKINSGAGALAPTASWDGSDSVYMNFSVWRPQNTVTLDQVNEALNTPATMSHSHGSITTTGVGLILTTSGMAADTTPTRNTNFTELTNNISGGGRDYHQYWITSGAQTTDGVYTTSGSVISTACIVSFLDSGGGGGGAPPGPPPGSLQLLGIGR